MGDREVCQLSSSVSRIRTFVSVDLDVIRGEEKLSKVEQPRVDVSAVVKKSNLQTARWSS